MSGLDIEAIRERAQKFEDLGTELSPSNYRIVATAARSAGDVPVLLAQIERERAAMDEALATVRAQAAEIERLRGRIREILGERDEARRDLAEADHEVDRMRVEIKRMVAHVHEQSEHDRLQREVVVAELAACRGALADALQVIADLRGGTQ